ARLRRAGDELAVGEVDHWRSRRDRVHHLFGGFRPVAVFHGRNGKFGSVRQVRVWIDAPVAVLVHHRGVFRAGLAVRIDLDDRSGLAGAGDGLAAGGVDVRRFRREGVDDDCRLGRVAGRVRGPDLDGRSVGLVRLEIDAPASVCLRDDGVFDAAVAVDVDLDQNLRVRRAGQDVAVGLAHGRHRRRIGFHEYEARIGGVAGRIRGGGGNFGARWERLFRRDAPIALAVGLGGIVDGAVVADIDRDRRTRLGRAGNHLAVGRLDNRCIGRHAVDHRDDLVGPVPVLVDRPCRDLRAVGQLMIGGDAPMPRLVDPRPVFHRAVVVDVDLDNRARFARTGKLFAVGGVDCGLLQPAVSPAMAVAITAATTAIIAVVGCARNGDGTSDTRGQSAYEERQRERCRAYPQGPAADDGLKNARYIIGKVDTDKTVAVVGDEPQRRLAVRVVAEVIGEHDLFAVLQHEDEVVTPAHVALHGA